MAKQTGILKIEGTINNITFYRIDNKYFARQKSSLTARRVKTRPEFEGTRQSYGRLANASRLGSKVYRAVKTKNDRALYQRITGDAILLIKQGIALDKAEVILTKKYQQTRKPVVKKAKPVKKELPRSMQYELKNEMWVLATIRSCLHDRVLEPVWVYN